MEDTTKGAPLGFEPYPELRSSECMERGNVDTAH